MTTPDDLDSIHNALRGAIARAGGRIEVFSHLPDASCSCRKTAPRMLRRAAEMLGFSASPRF